MNKWSISGGKIHKNLNICFSNVKLFPNNDLWLKEELRLNNYESTYNNLEIMCHNCDFFFYMNHWLLFSKRHITSERRGCKKTLFWLCFEVSQDWNVGNWYFMHSVSKIIYYKIGLNTKVMNCGPNRTGDFTDLFRLPLFLNKSGHWLRLL